MTAHTIVRRGLTWQEYVDLPDLPAYHRAELIDGDLVVTTPTAVHQRVMGNVLMALKAWTRAGSGRGEATSELIVRVAELTGYLPDVMWYAEHQCAPPGQPPAFDGPPALAVEVLSPSTRRLDAVRKRNDYARVGVRELWLIDCDVPEALIARQLDDPATGTFVDVADLDADGQPTSPMLDGFTINLRDLITRR